MILVTLGTQDKTFERLLVTIDEQIKKGNIKDKVVVQAGSTKYESDNMEIHDFLTREEYDEYIKKCDLLITHGGVGTILSGLNNGKVVIATPRLAKYKEHHNDHQKQIVGEFAKEGYILELDDMNDLGKMIKEVKKFKPKKFVSNTNNMIKLIENYIEDSDNVSWLNKYGRLISYIILVLLIIIVLLIVF